MESSRQIEQTAADWIVRRDSDDWTAADAAALDAWVNASTAHQAAFWRLEAAWEQTSRLQALGAGTPAGIVPPAGEWQVSPFFDRHPPAVDLPLRAPTKPARLRSFAVAASVLLLAGIGVYLLTALQGDRYVTPVGGMASISLQDGSSVTLNTASKIRVVLSEQERLIKLEGGEAFFDVAKDAQRPFVVQAGKRRIVAVGTRFSVRRDDDDMQVVVTEGRVRVEEPAGSAAAPVNKDGAALLVAGTVARASNSRLVVEERTPLEAEEALSWRSGYLTFESSPLPEAIAEFNRYTPRKITIGDPQVANRHVSGRFRATNVDAFLRMLRQGFGIQATESNGGIVLTSHEGT